MKAIVKKVTQPGQMSKEALRFTLICGILKNISYLRIFRSLVKYDSLTTQDVVKILKISHYLANRHLKKLTTNDILIEKEINNLSHYSLNASNKSILIVKNFIGAINK